MAQKKFAFKNGGEYISGKPNPEGGIMKKTVAALLMSAVVLFTDAGEIRKLLEHPGFTP